MDHSRLVELEVLRANTARRRAAALRDRARSVSTGSRRARELSRTMRVGIQVCRELWDDIRQVPPPERRLPVCRVCGTVCTPARRWTAVPTVVLRHLESHPDVIPLTPAVCPHCFNPHDG
jgi:hypothetical protein